MAEARAAVAASVQAAEKRLAKARRAIESERSAEDFLNLWQGVAEALAQADEKVSELRAAVAGAAGGGQQEFLDEHGAYLNGLQGHMLGQGDSENLAGRLFKKCAYVADSVYRNKQIGL